MPDTILSKKAKKRKLQAHIKAFLKELGFDLNHSDLKGTPERVARLWIEENLIRMKSPKLVKAGKEDLSIEKKIFKTFPSKQSSMVTLINHRAFSRCPHHLERVVMDISIAYIPNGRLLGLSKLARIADYYSAGLMLQEEIAEAIVEGLMIALKPLGAACYIKANHMCMMSRGVKSTHSSVTTNCIRGLFKEDLAAREEFLMQIREGGLKW